MSKQIQSQPKQNRKNFLFEENNKYQKTFIGYEGGGGLFPVFYVL